MASILIFEQLALMVNVMVEPYYVLAKVSILHSCTHLGGVTIDYG